MPPAPFYRGRTALVTGASGGLGADMARLLGARGARVLLVARRERALGEVAEAVRQRGGQAAVFVADLEAPDAAAALVDRVEAAGEAVDVLVNNAGFGVVGPFLTASPDEAEGMTALNVTAPTGLARRLLPGMVARGCGGVLTVASIAAFTPAPGFAVYAATKAYALAFSEALAFELRGTGAHATCLCPGPVRTGFAERAGMSDRFFAGALPSERVARAGLDGLAAGRRRVVPGWTNKAQTAATRLVPPGLLLRAAERMLRPATADGTS
jgi:short-subunit dehydrogenase